MAPRKAAPAPTPTARKGRVPMELSDYLTKPATTTQTQFADWLIEKVGYAPTQAKTKADAFRDGVKLAVGMRIAFQTSDEAQAVIAEKRASNGGTPAKAVKAAKATKAAPAKAVKAVKTAPAKKTTPAKETTPTVRRGRPPTKAATATTTAPPVKAARSAKATKAAKTTPATAPPQAKPRRATAKATTPPPPPPADTIHIADDDVPF